MMHRTETWPAARAIIAEWSVMIRQYPWKQCVKCIDSCKKCDNNFINSGT
jgi:hypothetical protein